jgi:hypothetical protein
MGLFEGGFGVIRGEVWVNALQGTLACCTHCLALLCTTYTPHPPGWVAGSSTGRYRRCYVYGEGAEEEAELECAPA